MQEIYIYRHAEGQKTDGESLEDLAGEIRDSGNLYSAVKLYLVSSLQKKFGEKSVEVLVESPPRGLTRPGDNTLSIMLNPSPDTEKRVGAYVNLMAFTMARDFIVATAPVESNSFPIIIRGVGHVGMVHALNLLNPNAYQALFSNPGSQHDFTFDTERFFAPVFAITGMKKLWEEVCNQMDPYSNTHPSISKLYGVITSTLQNRQWKDLIKEQLTQIGPHPAHYVGTTVSL